MTLAWSITEVIRYAYYAFNVAGYEPYPLLWLRYTTFYVLYPIGAGSEAFLMFSTLPISYPPVPKDLLTFGLWDFVRLGLYTLWWPGTCSLPYPLVLVPLHLTRVSFDRSVFPLHVHDGPATEGAGRGRIQNQEDQGRLKLSWRYLCVSHKLFNQIEMFDALGNTDWPIWHRKSAVR